MKSQKWKELANGTLVPVKNWRSTGRRGHGANARNRVETELKDESSSVTITFENLVMSIALNSKDRKILANATFGLVPNGLWGLGNHVRPRVASIMCKEEELAVNH